MNSLLISRHDFPHKRLLLLFDEEVKTRLFFCPGNTKRLGFDFSRRHNFLTVHQVLEFRLNLEHGTNLILMSENNAVGRKDIFTYHNEGIQSIN